MVLKCHNDTFNHSLCHIEIGSPPFTCAYVVNCTKLSIQTEMMINIYTKSRNNRPQRKYFEPNKIHNWLNIKSIAAWQPQIDENECTIVWMLSIILFYVLSWEYAICDNIVWILSILKAIKLYATSFSNKTAFFNGTLSISWMIRNFEQLLWRNCEEVFDVWIGIRIFQSFFKLSRVESFLSLARGHKSVIRKSFSAKQYCCFSKYGQKIHLQKTSTVSYLIHRNLKFLKSVQRKCFCSLRVTRNEELSCEVSFMETIRFIECYRPFCPFSVCSNLYVFTK